jgi:signal transduction histidine kinase
MSSIRKSHQFTLRYALFGVAFGFSFPLLSWIIDAIVFRGIPLTFQSLVYIHQINPLHYVIDTAPLFLGISFGVAGKKQDDITRINQDLELQVLQRTTDLQHAIQKLETFSHALEEKVVQRTEALLQTNRVKDKMLSIISHDLRSPLTSLAGTLSLIQQNLLEEEERAMLLSRVTVDVHYTNELLENLLSWAYSKESGGGYRPEKFDLMPIVNNVVLLFHSMAGDKKITIRNFIPADHVVLADQNMITLVLRNLISNALKFTQPGGEVNVHAEKVDRVIRVSVKDTGIGMHANTIENLLNADQTLNTTRGTSNEKGTGIGLMLCKEFIEKHASAITILSTPGLGSAFSFDLPAAATNS